MDGSRNPAFKSGAKISDWLASTESRGCSSITKEHVAGVDENLVQTKHNLWTDLFNNCVKTAKLPYLRFCKGDAQKPIDISVILTLSQLSSSLTGGSFHKKHHKMHMSKLLAAALVLSVIEESLSFSMTTPIKTFRDSILSKSKRFNRAPAFGSGIRPRGLRDQHSFGLRSMSESNDSNNVASFMLQAVQGFCCVPNFESMTVSYT